MKSIRWNRLIYPLVVVLAVTIVYLNHFENGFHFDDGHSVVNNPNIRSLANIPRFFVDGRLLSTLAINQMYRPMLPTTLAIDYYMAGKLDPFFFQLSTFFVFLLLLLCMGGLFEAVLPDRRQAWLGVALYGLHPVCAETVNYICQRTDVYVALGLTAGLWLYSQKRRHWALVVFAAAYFFKPSVLVFPGLILAYEFFLGERRYGRALPAIVIAAGLTVLNTIMTPSSYRLGAESPLAYRLTQPYIVLTYLAAAVWPTHLCADVVFPAFSNFLEPRALLGYAGLLVLGFCIFKAPRPVGFGLSWFVIALVPTSLAPLADVTNDHRMFGPFVGLALAAAGLASTRARQWLLIAVLPFLAYGTYQRNQVWRSDMSLWHDVTIKAPYNGRGWMNYGLAFYDQGRMEDCLSALLRAEELAPAYVNVHLNLGLVLANLGHHAEAEAHYKRALELDPGGTPHYHYGTFLLDRKRYAEGAMQVREAYRINPHDPMSARRLDALFHELAEKCEAEPSCANYLNLSVIQYIGGQYREALQSAQKASQLDPGSAIAQVNQAGCYLALENWQEARHHALAAQRLDPGNRAALQALERAESHLAEGHRP